MEQQLAQLLSEQAEGRERNAAAIGALRDKLSAANLQMLHDMPLHEKANGQTILQVSSALSCRACLGFVTGFRHWCRLDKHAA